MVAVNSSTLLGRKVVSVERTNAAKFVFEDGFCGAKASARLYVEAESAKARENLTRAASDWILKGA
jgi:hypothetical protein